MGATESANSTCVSDRHKVTHMEKTQAAGRSIAKLIRAVIRKVMRKPQARLQSGTASQSARPSNTIAFTTRGDVASDAILVPGVANSECRLGYPPIVPN